MIHSIHFAHWLKLQVILNLIFIFSGADTSSVCPSSGVSAASSPRPASTHSIEYSTPHTTPAATPLATPVDTPLATPLTTPLATPKRPEKSATPKSKWTRDHDYICSSPEVNDEALLLDERVVDGIKSKTKKSTKYDIKLVMQRKVQDNDKLQIEKMLVHDGSQNKEAYTPQEAIKALNAKSSVKVTFLLFLLAGKNLMGCL